MTGFAVFLGSWLAETVRWPATGFLMIAAMSATGFGNVINDIRDIASDRINHPGRPLPRGDISSRSASLFAVLVLTLSLASAASVSMFHTIATLLPLILLWLYALYLKGTPLTGNVLVALLVAYALLFGAIPQINAAILIIPALLAFLLNFSREVVKDIEDFEGDRVAGYSTSAQIPLAVLRKILICSATVYLALLFVPFLLDHFGRVYLYLSILLVFPLHILWFRNIVSKDFVAKTATTSRVLKLEMLAGLATMAGDKLI